MYELGYVMYHYLHHISIHFKSIFLHYWWNFSTTPAPWEVPLRVLFFNTPSEWVTSTLGEFHGDLRP